MFLIAMFHVFKAKKQTNKQERNIFLNWFILTVNICWCFITYLCKIWNFPTLKRKYPHFQTDLNVSHQSTWFADLLQQNIYKLDLKKKKIKVSLKGINEHWSRIYSSFEWIKQLSTWFYVFKCQSRTSVGSVLERWHELSWDINSAVESD